MKRLLAALVLSAAGCAGAPAPPEALPYYASLDLTPRFLPAREAASLHRIADFQAVDQDGRAVNGASLDGKVAVASFFFTSCPLVCPRIVENLRPVQAAHGADANVVMLSFSVDPQTDDVVRLRRFADTRKIDGRWRLLTGDKKAIYALARTSFFAESTAPGRRTEDDFLHTELVFLVDGNRHIRGVYDGMLPSDVARLVEDIRTLRKS